MATAVSERAYVPWSVGDSIPPLEAELGSVLEPKHYHEIAKDAEWQAVERAMVERSPWYWFVNYVVTEDAHWVTKGLHGPFARFPGMEYLRSLCQVLWEHPFVAFPKARQMLITWLVGCYMLGEAMWCPGRLYMIQSKKEQDAQAVLKRLSGVYGRMKELAPWLGPGLRGEGASHMEFDTGSSILAMAQGAHHVQSYTPAGLLLDEVQLQDEAEGAYYQALPACERIWLVGSADYSWFYQTFLPDKLGETRHG